MKKITTVINYCSIEYRFIKAAIEKASVFSNDVLVPVCTHFFSGETENSDLLNQTFQENPNATFIVFPYQPYLSSRYGQHFWHNMARWVSTFYSDKGSSHMLFLDADEVVDSEAFSSWVKTVDLDAVDAVKFLNYWYFKDVNVRADAVEDSVVLTRKLKLSPKILFQSSERHALKVGAYLDKATGLNGDPMIHHYSWVRTKKEMIQKVKNWGHRHDRNWEDIIESEFNTDAIPSKDFVHGYTLKQVSPFITLPVPLTRELPSNQSGEILRNDFPNVIFVSDKQFRYYLSRINWMERFRYRFGLN